MDTQLALTLVNTVRVVRRTRGRVRDVLRSPEGLRGWLDQVHERWPMFPTHAVPADSATADRLVEVRQALRALFAHAVAPDPPSAPDAHELPDLAVALATVNQVLREAEVTPHLVWPGDGEPDLHWSVPVDLDDRSRAIASLTWVATRFLASPAREQLRACPAPLCVLYFVKEHHRQQWCSSACGNRARVSRYYYGRRESDAVEESAS
ncbi:CGNR zinc finger domain-containing protein [Saccharothrix hoggarensis]|uniref:CGNR zinc finger domain-containing protein n=1 Tax=Saccharothrix hoggarensis TaxID=913853 RepID=A0ABW3R3R5_9PSEU